VADSVSLAEIPAKEEWIFAAGTSVIPSVKELVLPASKPTTLEAGV
jgi:hypothetical protein